jgi:hypothetical protein
MDKSVLSKLARGAVALPLSAVFAGYGITGLVLASLVGVVSMLAGAVATEVFWLIALRAATRQQQRHLDAVASDPALQARLLAANPVVEIARLRSRCAKPPEENGRRPSA